MRLIDADALWDQYKIEYDHADALGNAHRKKGWQGALQLLYDAPTIDPETLRPTGHWNIRSSRDILHRDVMFELFLIECSECKRKVLEGVDQEAARNGEYRKLVEQFPYCHCGCKMMEG